MSCAAHNARAEYYIENSTLRAHILHSANTFSPIKRARSQLSHLFFIFFILVYNIQETFTQICRHSRQAAGSPRQKFVLMSARACVIWTRKQKFCIYAKWKNLSDLYSYRTLSHPCMLGPLLCLYITNRIYRADLLIINEKRAHARARERSWGARARVRCHPRHRMRLFAFCAKIIARLKKKHTAGYTYKITNKEKDLFIKRMFFFCKGTF